MSPPTNFVPDNSVVMTWCFEDQSSPYADAILESLSTREALVPAIWPLDVANVLVGAERRGRLSPSDSAQFVELLAGLPIQAVQQTSKRVLSDVLGLARNQDLSSYDASYLDLAMRSGCPLATLDQALREAAGRVQVPLLDL